MIKMQVIAIESLCQIGAINCALEKDSTDAYAIFADKLFKKRAFTALFA